MKQVFKVFVLVLSVFLFIGCSPKKEDINIGFVAGVTGKYSALGTSIRDGFILAFDEIDNNIDGHKVNIIQKDDKQDKIEAKKIIDGFIKDGIKLIIGNSTSSMTAVSFPIVNKQKDMLLFSATASGGDFTGKDDNFIRLQVEHSEKRYQALKNYVNKNKFKNIFFIYDSKNRAYIKGYDGFFQSVIIKSGGNKFVGRADLNTPYSEIISKIKSTENDLILVVGNSVDSANIIQYIRLNNIDTQVMATGWAKTMDFIINGGKSVEGVIFSTGYDDNSKDKLFLEFAKKFKAKYKQIPSVFSTQGYEVAQVLIKNLKYSTDIKTLKKRILEEKKYVGLQGDIVFDKYGDISREYFMMEVKNAQYVKVK